MELLFVHLTDIHLKEEKDFDVLLQRTGPISNAIKSRITNEENTTVFLCITGDMTYSGTEEQFGYISLFIDGIIEEIRKKYNKIFVQVVAVPGNHDCNYEDSFTPTRDLLLNSIELNSVDTPEVMPSYTRIQDAYFKYVDTLDKVGFGCENDKILTENIFCDSKNKITVKFHCINTAWCSKKKEKREDIFFRTHDNYEKTEEDIIVTLLHHDESWLEWESAQNWRDYYKKYSDIVFVGHDHVSEYVYKENYNEASNYFIKGNQLYSSENSEQSGFNILKIDLNTQLQTFFSYEWNGKIYTNIIDTKSAPFIRNRYYESGITIKKKMQDFLENMEIDLFSKYKDTVYLSDVYEYPTLRGKAITTKKNIVHYREKENILRVIDEKNYIFILGEREYGKTALLKKLYKEFFDIGKLPVWIDVSKINSADDKEIEEYINEFYGRQYENIDVEEIFQMDGDNKVCIIDNFDEISLSDKSIKKTLQYLTNKFDTVLLSSTPTKRMVNFLKCIETNKYIEEKFFEMQICELRNYGRRQLINKWLLLADPEKDVNGLEFDTMRKEKESQVEIVMRNGFFHNTPLEFLLVLSHLENTTRINADYGRYSYIYDCLSKGKINELANGDSNDAAMYQTILEQLAYKMYETKELHSVEENFLTKVIYDYNQEYTGAPGEVLDMINKLLRYGLIMKTSKGYRFKYDYMLYYFTCGYIRNQIPPKDRENIINEILSDVSKELNYNIALFLAFVSNVEFEMLPQIISAANNVLPEYATFQYKEQNNLVIELEKDIEAKVEKIFSIPMNQNISEIQERNAIILDMIEEESVEDEESLDEELDNMTLDLMKLLRLTELMGDIIKNYAGRLSRKPRVTIIDEMYKATMKTMGKMATSMEYIIGRIMKIAEEKQKENEDDYLIKSRFVIELKEMFYELWKTYISANVKVLAHRLECERIKKEIELYGEQNECEFYRMVKVEYLINTCGGKLPVSEIDSCFYGKNPLKTFSQQILREIIAKDLCSSQFEPISKQAVCASLEFNIKDVRIEVHKNIALQEM